MNARHPIAPKRSRFVCPATSKELEQSSKGFLVKNTEKRPMGYAGISGLVKNRNAQTEEKPLSGRYTEHRRCRDIGKMAFAIMAWSTEIQVDCNTET